jgi:tetratricopeptide (TPR) repeat protein
MAEVSASLLYNIGMCFFNSSSWKQAEVYFNETIMINANHIKALHRRALARYHLQKYEEAMNDIKQAFNKDKRNV